MVFAIHTYWILVMNGKGGEKKVDSRRCGSGCLESGVGWLGIILLRIHTRGKLSLSFLHNAFVRYTQAYTLLNKFLQKKSFLLSQCNNIVIFAAFFPNSGCFSKSFNEGHTDVLYKKV